MKRRINTLLFLLLVVLVSPIVFSACQEVKFEDVPYNATGTSAEEVITNFNEAGNKMVSSLGLKIKLETTNVYNFYNTSKSSSKVVKDVITTTLGSTRNDTSVVIVDTTRYINGEKKTNLVNTYVNVKADPTAYCYSYFKNFENEEDVYEKAREEYDATSNSIINFYKSVILELNPNEIDRIYSKEFEEITYYKLVSGVNGLGVVKEKFSETSSLLEDPKLFQILSKSQHDYVDNYFYECALDGSGYVKYFSVNYNLISGEREKYLTATSTTHLTQYGDSVNTQLPNDLNEYTASGFMKTMLQNNSYVSYSLLPPSGTSQTNYTVAKLDSNYFVRVDDYSSLALTTTNYFLKNNGEGFISYLIDGQNKTLSECAFKLDLLNFDFSLKYSSNEGNIYQFGNDETYTKVSIVNNEVYSLTGKIKDKEEELTIYINRYGKYYKAALGELDVFENYEII